MSRLLSTLTTATYKSTNQRSRLSILSGSFSSSTGLRPFSRAVVWGHLVAGPSPVINRLACHAPGPLVKLHTILLETTPTASLHTALRSCGNIASVTSLQTYPALPFAVPGSVAVCQPAGIPYENARENHFAEHRHTHGSSSWGVGRRSCQPRLAWFLSRYPRQRGSCADGRFAECPKFRSSQALTL
jgi:hypothetical protein